MRRVLIFASSLLFLPAFATAQHHSGIAFAGRPIVAAPRVGAPHVVAPAPVRAGGGAAPYTGVRVQAGTRSGNGTHKQARVSMRFAGHARATTRIAAHASGSGFRTTRQSNGVTSGDEFFEDEFFEDEGTTFQNVPGLGFDFPHLAAISGGRPEREDEGFFPLGFGGFLLSSPSVIVQEAPPVEQQPMVDEGVAGNANDLRAAALERRESRIRSAEARLASKANAAPALQNDAPEYVFVRRDGGLVFAVAYSWDNGTLRYITRDGVRRSLARDALDMDATQQLNEQRGVNFRSPA